MAEQQLTPDSSHCYACGRKASKTDHSLPDGRVMCGPCHQHQFRLKHVTLAEILSNQREGTRPYYVAWCSCGSWRSARFGHMINNTDDETKAALTASSEWRKHVAQSAAPSDQPVVPVPQPALL